MAVRRLWADTTLLVDLITSLSVQGLVSSKAVMGGEATLLSELITCLSVQGLVGSMTTLIGVHHSTSRPDNILFST